jgi:hypothetical protein
VVSRIRCLGGALTLLVVLPAFAQYLQLTATDDGGQLYFVTQQILQGKAHTFPEYRLYRAGPDGVTLAAERGKLAPDGTFSSSSGVVHPSVSGDGAVLAYTFNDVCASATDCNSSVNSAVIRGSRFLDLGPGTLQLSRDGKWALLTHTEFSSTDPMVMGITTTNILVDLTNGARGPVYTIADEFGAAYTKVLASDGIVFGFTLTGSSGVGGVATANYGLWKQGQFTPVILPTGYGPRAH